VCVYMIVAVNVHVAVIVHVYVNADMDVYGCGYVCRC